MNKFFYMLIALTFNTGRNCCEEKREEYHLLQHQKQSCGYDQEKLISGNYP